MFHWFAKRRRRNIIRTPFPTEWGDIIDRHMVQYRLLTSDERTRLHSLIQIFIAEKSWEGCGGLVLTDEIRVTVAASACLLILNLAHNYYENVETIIIYPADLVLPARKLGFFETAQEPLEPDGPVSGQAFEQGPLILSWDAIMDGVRHAGSGYNVVYHEFAHKLDMLAGVADGTPRLRDSAEYHDWIRTCSREFRRLVKDMERRKRTFIDEYGATDEAEFFAVATEHFFDQPLRLIKSAPELYRVLKQFYRQDPAKRIRDHFMDGDSDKGRAEEG